MKKCLGILFALGLSCYLSSNAFADSVVTEHGTVKGKIVHVLDGLIEVKTPAGSQYIQRGSTLERALDIIEVGFIKKRTLTGYIMYLDDNSAEIETPTGRVKLYRYNVRNVVLSEQRASDL